MSDVSTLDQALLQLEQELSAFRELRPKLDGVREEAEAILSEFRVKSSEIEQESQRAVREARDQYGTLSERNREQFEAIRSACGVQLELVAKGVQKVEDATGSLADLSARVAEVAARIGEVGKMLHELNLPVRMEKLDASIVGALAAVQSVQSRFDRMSAELSDGFRAATRETLQQIKESERRLDKGIRSFVEDQTSSLTQQVSSVESGLTDFIRSAADALCAQLAAAHSREHKLLVWTVCLLGVVVLGLAGLLTLSILPRF